MKTTKVTEANAALILFRIKKFINSNEAVKHYSDWGKYPKLLNKMGVKSLVGKHVEKTITVYIIPEKCSFRIEKNYGIIINIGSASAIVIHFGNRIKIFPNQIIVKGVDNCINKPFTTYFSPSAEVKKAKQQIDFEDEMDKQYWEDVRNGLFDEVEA
jgi:hypothetical protein